MSIAVTVPAVQDIMDTEEERRFWEVVRHHERPPFYDVAEGVNNRLNRAARLVYEEKIQPHSDGSYSVEGTNGHVYRVREHCSCPDSTHRQRHCYHFIAVCLYVEWQRRLRTTPPPLGTQALASDPDDDDNTIGNGYPVDDETLPLPLPPTSVDERLAHAPYVPQEDRMTEDAYIPEPETDSAPVAVLEAPRATQALTVPLGAHSLEHAMAEWIAQRRVITRFLQQELKEGTDYYSLTIRGRETKPTLSKAGAEKFLALFQLQAAFAPDLLTWEMLGKPTDQLLYVCTLRTRAGEIVGEGRGSRCLKQDGGDTNKALKMSEKSALIDAVLRTGALSDCFTQDLDDHPEAAPATAPAKPTGKSQDLRQRIWAIVKERAPQTAGSREAVADWVQQQTGYALHPDNYPAIVQALRARP
jgi:hypothetical protein